MRKISRKKLGREENLHDAVCIYLKLQYPDVVFATDASGVRLPIGLASKFARLKSESGLPDIFIYEPKDGFHGLFMELKREGERVWLKDGSLSKDKHIQKQNKLHEKLRKKGYYGGFVIGLDKAKAYIDAWMDAKFSFSD